MEALLVSGLRDLKHSGSEQIDPWNLPCCGRPTTATSPKHVRNATIIRQDVLYAEHLALQLSFCSGGSNAVIEAFRYSKACTRWVPYSLTVEHKEKCEQDKSW